MIKLKMYLLNRLILEFVWQGLVCSSQSPLSFHVNASCWSSVGNRRVGLQQLSIGANCDRIATIQHEFLHALGFWHEQSRSDRDDYVSIVWERIQSGQSLSGFLSSDAGVRGFNGGTHLTAILWWLPCSLAWT